MTEDQYVQRARVNLAAAGIPASEEDLEGMVQRGFLEHVRLFDEYVATLDADQVPDFLDVWGEGVNGASEPVSSEPSAEVSAGPIFGQPEGEYDASDIRYQSVVEIGAMLRRREISAVELTRQSLERISDRDPILNGFQSLTVEHALQAAKRADEELDAGTDRGPLHGIPVAIKDLLAMRGTVTTAGSAINAGRITDYDADVVERLEAAGAIIVGKTRMSEFAYSPGSNNEHYGSTRNPWNLEHDTGGSSSGSAAAVADGQVYASIGSDTGGSIRMPGALCGVVGIKPTFGRVSLYGSDSLAWSLDHLGPFARTVADVALLMNILAGYDSRDPRTRKVPVPDYTAGLNDGVKGLRVGVLVDNGSPGPLATDEAMESFKQSAQLLQDQGAELVDISLPELTPLGFTNSAIVRDEAATFHEANLRTHFELYSRFMRQRVISAWAAGPTSYLLTSQARAILRSACQRIWNDVDVLLTPAMPYEAPMLGDPSRNTTFTAPFNTLGWPGAVVPISLSSNGLPLSTQIVGKPWDDALVLQVSSAMEAGRGTVR